MEHQEGLGGGGVEGQKKEEGGGMGKTWIQSELGSPLLGALGRGTTFRPTDESFLH